MPRRNASKTTESVKAEATPVPERESAPALPENDIPPDYSLDESPDGGPPQVDRPAPDNSESAPAPEKAPDASEAPAVESTVPDSGDGSEGLTERQAAIVAAIAPPIKDSGEAPAVATLEAKGDTAPTQPDAPAPVFSAPAPKGERTFTVNRNVSVFKPGAVVSMEMLGIKEEHLERLISGGTIYENDPR